MSFRSLLALLAVAALSLAIGPHFGYYTRSGLFWFLPALGLALAACLLPERQSPVYPGQGRWLLAGVTLFLSGRAALQAQLFYAESKVALAIMVGTAYAGFAAVVLLLADVLAYPARRPGFPAWVLLVFLTGAVVRGSVIFASPDPVIDVYGWRHEAPDHLLHGRNPYAETYHSPYGTERARKYRVLRPAEDQLAAYAPQPILIALPFRAAGLDVRWANVICDLLAALCLFLAARARGAPVLGALLAGCYLHLPCAGFLIEQAWNEPMIAALVGGGLLLVEHGRRGRRWGYLLLGFGLTAKQFGAVLLPSLWRARRDEWRPLLAGIAFALLALLLPFFLWDRDAFLSIILFKHLEHPLALNSFTLLSVVHDLTGVTLSRHVPLLLGVPLIAWLAWKTPRQGTGAGLWMGTALFVFCFCHTQGFFHYYYLCQYLLLLGIAGAVTAEARPRAERKPAAKFAESSAPPLEVPGRVL
jgi:hypothetical protein